MVKLELEAESQVALAEALEFVFSQGAVRASSAARPLLRILEQLDTEEARKFKDEALKRQKEGKP